MSDHDALRDNAGAWVLGALDEDEAWRFSAHLEVCDSCQAEVARLRVAADALPLAAPPEDPPPALKRRLMEIVNAEADPERSPRRERSRPAWLQALFARPALAAAAAALLIVAGGVAGFALHGESGVQARTVALSAPRGAQASLVQTADGAVVRVQHLPAPPRGRVYQVWLQRGGGIPKPDAVFTVDRRGRGAVGVQGDVTKADTVLVTAEPAGGSRSPTSTPLLQGKIA